MALLGLLTTNGKYHGVLAEPDVTTNARATRRTGRTETLRISTPIDDGHMVWRHVQAMYRGLLDCVGDGVDLRSQVPGRPTVDRPHGSTTPRRTGVVDQERSVVSWVHDAGHDACGGAQCCESS